VVPISSMAPCTVVAPRPLWAFTYGTSPAAGAPLVVPDVAGLVASHEIAYAPMTVAPASTPSAKCADPLRSRFARLNMCASPG
jgi:hypothetical protein